MKKKGERGKNEEKGKKKGGRGKERKRETGVCTKCYAYMTLSLM